MAVCDEGSDPDTIDLKLSNSPYISKGEIGMLDTLLEWRPFGTL